VFEQLFGPWGNPVGELVGAELVVLVTSVVESTVLDELVLVINVVLLEYEETVVAMQVQALLTRPATFPVHAATAYEGIALVAVTEDAVNAPQKECASASLVGALSARRQLSALQAAAATADGSSRGMKIERSILNEADGNGIDLFPAQNNEELMDGELFL
jgi:hypothetical protein